MSSHPTAFAAIEYKEWISFLLHKSELVFVPQVSGDLKKVYLVFHHFSSAAILYETFETFVIQFAKMSDAMKLCVSQLDQRVWIESIDHLKLCLLQSHISGDVSPAITLTKHQDLDSMDTQKPSECLMKMLDTTTSVSVDVSMYDLSPVDVHPTLDDMMYLLHKPVASMTLAKQRAKLSVPVKQFFVACNDPNHSKLLASVCLGRAEGANGSKQAFPSMERCFSLLENSKKSIPKPVQECAKTKIHFLPIINSNTDTNLGDCSYLDTCHKMRSCRYLHYLSLVPIRKPKPQARDLKRDLATFEYTTGLCFNEYLKPQLPPQWINCDVRKLPFLILGKFAAIISDPAWDIHMSLPYGTCSDEELSNLPMNELQDEGVMFLWVTGRSIEIGRTALTKWGYTVSDEMIWIKLNQLKRTIVTGRTGHWLNHSKEHLLVGIKGDPPWISRHVDINTIVSSTRETLRKPDEIYDIVDRLVGPSARKLEIFGRDHNLRHGWVTIGNQLDGTSIVEREMLQKYKQFKQ